jgi:hypothetical protein
MTPTASSGRKGAEYHEVEILGRRCYITQEDIRIFYGLTGSVTGTKKKAYSDLPDDALIVRVVWIRKWSLVKGVERFREGIRKRLTLKSGIRE